MTETQWMQCFSKKLRELLDYTNMTQTDLAIESGLSNATISNYINCVKMPKVTAIVNLAYALNCSIEDLIDFGSAIT